MPELTFVLDDNIPLEDREIIYGMVSTFFEKTGLEVNINTIRDAYISALIGCAVLYNTNIEEDLQYLKFEDQTTIEIINCRYNEHIKIHLEDIIKDIDFDFGGLTIDAETNTIGVDYLGDSQKLGEYFLKVRRIAVTKTLMEYDQECTANIEKDLLVMEKLYGQLPKWDLDEQDEKLAKFCNQEDPQLIEKFGSIVYLMRDIPFRSKVFKKCLAHYFNNQSKPWCAIQLRYFTLAIKKGGRYQDTLTLANKHIQEMERVKKEIQEKKEQITKSNAENKQSFYSSLLD